MLSNLRQPRDEEAGLSRVLGSNGNEDNEEDTGSQEKPVSTGQHYRTKRPIISLNFSPNGKLLLASSDKETYVFDINSKVDIEFSVDDFISDLCILIIAATGRY
jgi:WD40 repeat protein